MIVNRSFLISSLTFIFVFFPYIGPKIFPSENQPYALLFSSVWLLLINKNKIKLLKGHYLLISTTFVALLIAITELEFFTISFRSLIGYLSFLILNIFFYNHSRYYCVLSICYHAFGSPTSTPKKILFVKAWDSNIQ